MTAVLLKLEIDDFTVCRSVRFVSRRNVQVSMNIVFFSYLVQRHDGPSRLYEVYEYHKMH